MIGKLFKTSYCHGAWDGTEVVFCCLPEFLGSWLGVNQPKPFVYRSPTRQKLSYNLFKKGEVNFQYMWSGLDPNPLVRNSIIYRLVIQGHIRN